MCVSYYEADCEFFFRSERGKYYALDLGGTNFRVLRIQLGGKRSSILSCDVERQPIPQDLMTSTSEVAYFVAHKFFFAFKILPYSDNSKNDVSFACRISLILLLHHLSNLLKGKHKIQSFHLLKEGNLALHSLFL